MLTEEDSTNLTKELNTVDELVTKHLITRERGEEWKQRILDKFETSAIPAAVEKKLPNDMSHLPGRIIGGLIGGMKAIARGSGATYEALSKQEGYDPRSGDKIRDGKKRRSNDPNDMLDNLPEMYR
jgi:hypothetical protein